MAPNVLITGAAGYIGGSLVADFVAGDKPLFTKDQIHAAVRSAEQANALSTLGINVFRLDLLDEDAVAEKVALHEITVIIHTASSIDPRSAINLISALGKQSRASGEQTYFLHTSGLSAFYEKSGWPAGPFIDTGPVFEIEKRLADSFPIRKTDVTVIEHAKAQGVTSFIVVPSVVYGRGSGVWNQLSVVLPAYVQGSIAERRVHRFAENTKVAGVHISDLTALYARIVDTALRGETLPSGEEGYYFALAHDLQWWEVLQHLATALDARGLVDSTDVPVWANDGAAAAALGVPEQFVQALWNSGGDMVAERPRSIGWEPGWDKARFLKNIDDEIKDVLELGKPKSSLVDSLFAAARG